MSAIETTSKRQAGKVEIHCNSNSMRALMCIADAQIDAIKDRLNVIDWEALSPEDLNAYNHLYECIEFISSTFSDLDQWWHNEKAPMKFYEEEHNG